MRLHLRNFLYETFCLVQETDPEAARDLETCNLETCDLEERKVEKHKVEKHIELANDRLSGGLHTGLLEQFWVSNRSEGYFDAGWRLVAEEGESLRVEKYGVVLSATRSHHLSSAAQTISHDPKQEQYVAIKLPGYRFEPGYYVAIGDSGPVETAATEIYFAASAAIAHTLMETITTALNSQLKMPYTLRVPYTPEDYCGPEAIALRIESANLERVKPLLAHIRQQHSLYDLRDESPLFATPLQPGITFANVIESNVTKWFGSSADLSRTEIVATVLTESLYSSLSLGHHKAQAIPVAAIIKTKLTESGVLWNEPHCSQPLAS